jgi:hypothetical protein
MLNDVSFRLMHRHGENDYVPMAEHTSTDHDIERGWLRGARIFKCTTCEEEIILVPPTAEPGDQST